MGKKIFYDGPGDYVADKPGETLSFAHWNHPVSINDVDIDDGNGGHATYEGFQNLVLTNFNDFFFGGGGTIHGGKGDDTLVDAFGSGTLYGDAGNDHLFLGQNEAEGVVAFYGGAGDDTLDGWSFMQMTGGGGNDTFVLNCETFLGDTSIGGVTVEDFHHNVDHINFSTNSTNPSLTNEGDHWTVHTDLGDSTFVIAGVTHLDPTDYDFILV